jgi:hypothetical protein
MPKLRAWVCFGLKDKHNNIVRTTPLCGSTSRSGLITFRANVSMGGAERLSSPAARKLGEAATGVRYWDGDSNPRSRYGQFVLD